MKLSMIAALSTNNVIGRNNDVPWRLSTDLKRFKALTMGHHLLMGRKTYESVGKPLPGRINVVITRREGYAPEGVTVVHSLEEAIRVAAAANDAEAFIAGGAEIYAQSMHRADRMYLTRVHADVEGDTFFPDFDDVTEWRLTDSEHCDADEKNEHPFSFLTYERAGAEGHAIPAEG
ncbi:MAG TPA: dihydrofolate reductase [Thermoanaerobaculia bacterium]|nr:dihydrofolate reductase [Thermoanaerobaculia bacterium]